MGTLPIAFETAGDTLKEMEDGRRDAKASRIDATTKVNDVLRLHPRTGEVFIQHGPLSVAEEPLASLVDQLAADETGD
jgi:hypothetical protein